MSALFHLPKAVRIQSDGRPYARALAYFYETGTLNDKDVHTDAALTIPFSQPLQADSDGQFAPIYINALDNYKLILKTSAGVQIDSVDPAFSALFTSDQLAALTYPRTAAEALASITPTSYQYLEGDIRRYGHMEGYDPADLKCCRYDLWSRGE